MASRSRQSPAPTSASSARVITFRSVMVLLFPSLAPDLLAFSRDMAAVGLDERSHHLVDLVSDSFGEQRSADQSPNRLEAEGRGECDGSGDALGLFGEADEMLVVGVLRIELRHRYIPDVLVEVSGSEGADRLVGPDELRKDRRVEERGQVPRLVQAPGCGPVEGALDNRS